MSLELGLASGFMLPIPKSGFWTGTVAVAVLALDMERGLRRVMLRYPEFVNWRLARYICNTWITLLELSSERLLYSFQVRYCLLFHLRVHHATSRPRVCEFEVIWNRVAIDLA